MKITKCGHCCLLVETKALRILTDPGEYSVTQNNLLDIDIVLITHEHADHLHIESLKKVLENNPDAQVLTNAGVGAKLTKEGIGFTLFENRDTTHVKGVLFEAFDCRHEEMHLDFGQVQNTAFCIDEKLLYPGDSFFNPNKDIEILALPVAGPWCTIHNAIQYALAIRPKKCFPVHDGGLDPHRRGATRTIPTRFLAEVGIEFVDIQEGETKEF